MLNPYSFEAGRLVCTAGVAEAMQSSISFSCFVSQSVQLYLNADWGSTCPEDWEANDAAIRNGSQILAVYTSEELSQTIWIMTEANRQYTTILLPEEYRCTNT